MSDNEQSSVENIEKKDVIDPQTKIGDISPIQYHSHAEIPNITTLHELIEPPLLKPCIGLWEKGIKTTASSANRKDLEHGFAYINIDWDSLSEENKKIAKLLATKIEKKGIPFLTKDNVLERVVLVEPNPPKKYYRDGGFIKIAIPLNKDTTSEEVEEQISEITDKFIKQPATWVHSYSFEKLLEHYGINPEDKVSREDFIREGWYLDEASDLFYSSRELCLLKSGHNIDSVNTDK